MWKLNHKKNSGAPKFWAHHMQAGMRSDMRAFKALTPSFELITNSPQTSPLILASPHSGRVYPQGFLEQTNLSINKLRLPEDSFVDEIFMPLTENGIPLLRALFPRCYVDVNRSADELSLESLPKHKNTALRQISPRAQMGLGVAPTHITQDIKIYPRPLIFKQVEARLEALYHPYHTALSNMIGETKAKFGHAVLLDCHSMPGNAVSGKNRADFILGDLFGETCDPDTTDFLQNALEALGYSVTRNIPYAGGYVTRHYGKPRQNVQALQIEINKSLYLNQTLFTPHDGMTTLMEHMQIVVMEMASYLRPTMDVAAQ